MKTTKRLLVLLLAVCLCVGLMTMTASAAETASGAFGDNHTWSLAADGTLTISGSGDMPTDYRSYNMPWKDYADQITAVVIGEGVTSVCDWAFYYYYGNISSITLPSTMVTIGSSAFCRLPKVTTLTLPEGITTIGSSAFNGLSIQTLKLPDTLEELGSSAFEYCSKLNSIDFGTGLSSIGMYSFAHCDSLTYVYFPATISSIYQSAFRGCANLVEIEFEGAPKTRGGYASGLMIGYNAFAYCDLTNVYLPTTLRSVDGSAFSGNMDLEGVWASTTQVIDSVEGPKYLTDDRGCLYEWNYDLETDTYYQYMLVIVPAKLSGSYTIPDSVWSCDADFQFCSELTSLTYGANLGGISNLYGYFGCTSLKTLTAGGYDPEEDYVRFYNDANGVLYSENSSNLWLEFVPVGLTDYTIPAGVNKITYPALCNARLQNIYVEEGNTTFKSVNGVLYSADGTELIAYPGGRTETSFTVPAEVTRIADCAFAFADNLKTITFTGNYPSMSTWSFYGVKGTCYYPADDEMWEMYMAEVGVSMSGTEDLVWKPMSAASITKQPVGQKVRNLSTATFSVEVSGSNLTYQWQFKASNKAAWKNCTATGNKTATMKVQGTTAKSGYRYRCVITDASGNKLTSNAVYLYVLGIKTQPVAKNVKAGVVAKFTVNAAGHNKTFQWQYKNAAGKWVNATGTGNKTATLKVPAKVAFNGRMYRCVIKDSAGNQVISNAVKLTVFGVKTQPTAKSVKAGVNAKFSVTATGSGLKYQWQYKNAKGNWVNCTLVGSKTATLSVKATAARNGMQYRCRITDSLGRVITTKAVTLKLK